MLLHLLAIALTGFLLISSVPGSSFFSWHPTFMTLAYGILLYEGAAVFSSRIYKKYDIKSKITIHWILQVMATTFSLTGFAVVFYNKISRNKQHFVTWHAAFGLATIVATVAVCGGGVMAKYSTYLKKYGKPLFIKTLHASFSCITLLLSCISIITGMNSNYFIRTTSQYYGIWRMAMALPVILVGLVLLQVTKSYLPRYKTASK